MAGYTPLYISKMETGLVQSREEFILPEDAYPVLENAFIFRERILRRQGLQTLGRLQRAPTTTSFNVNPPDTGVRNFNLITRLSLESTAQITPGNESSIVITYTGGAYGDQTFTDSTGTGTLIITGAGTNITAASINYATAVLSLTFANNDSATLTFIINYYPGLPVMGLRIRELNTINIEQTVAFDTVYAYIFNNGAWQEFIPGTVWTGTDSEFFWTTNYWIGNANTKIFWTTNFSGPLGDPIRYTDGSVWVDFAPQIDAANNLLTQSLALLPFRGRLLAFNTWEGINLGASSNFPNRIRWAEIGNPFTTVSAIVSTVVADAWRDDIRGKGGFLDIPTSEDIVAVGFVRDNLVIYCERSTWQLRYTGRSIAPFQIERVNSELGAESTFSAVQFDTSLVGFGDKGIVECDSFKSERIDIKIPDLVFEFSNLNDGPQRVYGIRDFQQKLAYWTYPYAPGQEVDVIYPNRRLVYNYENDSWAIYTDSITCFGTFQPIDSDAWNSFNSPTDTWEQSDFPWINFQDEFPAIVAGNQQGFVMFASSNLQPKVSNDPTLTLTDVDLDGGTNVVTVTSANHNLESGQVIGISNIPAGTPWATFLNGNNYGIVVLDANTFQLWEYNPATQQFSTPLQVTDGTYIGGGLIAVRDGFSIKSKKFNFLDEGQNIQVGFIDILLQATSEGAITMNVYLDYNDNTPINTLNANTISGSNPPAPDTFFNSIIPTTTPNALSQSSKYWQRATVNLRGGFITIEYTLSNGQLVGPEQQSMVQIDAQIIFIRKAGRHLPIGV